MEAKPGFLPDSDHLTPLSRAVATLFPGYFALVMATGIISLACHFLGLPLFALPFFWSNIFFYFVLTLLLLLRLVFFRPHFRADFADPGRAVGFFTLVAGTCILGTQVSLIGQDHRAALVLFLAGGVLWGGLIYGVFTALIIPREKPFFPASIHGSWLISVVATQSVSVLAAVNAETLYPKGLLLLSLSLFLFGGFLYLVLITLIFYRLLFFALPPSDLVPSYWVNMGAAAITTLAGANLVLKGPLSPLMAGLHPFILGLTLLFWAVASWWIPLLTILWIWRHGFREIALTYHPQYWSMVFPLGMYTASTFQLSRIGGLELFSLLPDYFIYVALLAWGFTFLGLIRSVFRVLGGALKGKA